MAWIKKQPHLVLLIVIALAVIAGSGLLVMNAQAFNGKFDPLRQPVTHGTKVYQQEQQQLQDATSEFKAPATWKGKDTAASLLVATQYVLDDSGTKLVDFGAGEKWSDSLTKKKIPDKWFLNYRLPLFTNGVTRLDSDGDGFDNESEWRADPQTDPTKPESHPPYYTQLFVVKYIRVPFLLKFLSYDEDKPGSFTFQVDAITLRKRSALGLTIGTTIPGTTFRIDKFEHKLGKTANDTEVDLSELTLTNMATAQSVVLIYNKVADSPDSYALFKYCHPLPGTGKDIQVKMLQEFALLPEKDQRYKLLDINDQEALIQTPSGEKVKIPKLPAGYP